MRSQAYFFFPQHFNYFVTGTSFCSRRSAGSSAGRQVWINKVEISPQAGLACQFKICFPAEEWGKRLTLTCLGRRELFTLTLKWLEFGFGCAARFGEGPWAA